MKKKIRKGGNLPGLNLRLEFLKPFSPLSLLLHG